MVETGLHMEVMGEKKNGPLLSPERLGLYLLVTSRQVSRLPLSNCNVTLTGKEFALRKTSVGVKISIGVRVDITLDTTNNTRNYLLRIVQYLSKYPSGLFVRINKEG